MSNSIIFNNLSFQKGSRKVYFLFFLLGWFSVNSLQAQTTITDVAGLKAVSMTGSYILGNDIDLSGETNWTPIGTAATPFNGTFNGNGKVIKGLQIYRPTTDNVGLFGSIYYAEIKNLGLEIGAGGVKGQNYVGGLVGSYPGGGNGITNCYVTGIGKITGNSVVGGLIGSTGGQVSNCYSTVAVNGYTSGGLAGMNYSAISNCYTSGTVDGSFVGGLVGENAASATINNCVALSPSITGITVGRVVGAGGTIANCYALETMLVNGVVVTGGTATNKDGLNKTLANLQTQSTYSGWTFSTGNWAIWADNSFPYFQRQSAPVTVTETTTTYVKGTRNPAGAALIFYKQDGTTIPGTLSGTSSWTYTFTTAINFSDAVYVVAQNGTAPRSYLVTKPIVQIFCDGSGTIGKPYVICNAEQLNTMRSFLNDNTKYFKLKNDIDLTAWIAANNPANGWEPIGTDTNPFKGHFDGNGFAVKGLWMNRGNSTGLFGYVNDAVAEIKNLGVEIGPNGVTGGYNTGGLAGTIYAGTISGCYTMGGLINSYANVVGGLIGYNVYGTIKESFASVDVIATASGFGANVGGLVGYNQLGTISDSYASSSVNAVGATGGLVGKNAAAISSCYASGTIINGWFAGGLVGDNDGGTIKNSVAANPSVAGGWIGRILGGTGSFGTLTNVYALSSMNTTGGSLNSSNQGTAKSQTELQTQSTYTGLGWNFASTTNTTGIWEIWKPEPNSYPFFRRQTAPVQVMNSCDQGIQVNVRTGLDILGNSIRIDSLVVYLNGKRIGRGSQIGATTNWSCALDQPYPNQIVNIYAYELGKKVSFGVSTKITPTPRQALYTIGQGGNYTSLKQAADAYSNCGINQNTTFRIISNLTETEIAEFRGTAPGSDTYTLTITADGTQRKVSGAIEGPLVRLTAANNIVIDGGGSGSIKNLVFTNTSTSKSPKVRTIEVIKLSDSNKGKNITIKNVELALNAVAVNTFGSVNLLVTTDNITVDNCYIHTANENVLAERLHDLTFTNNLLTDAANTGLSISAMWPGVYDITGNTFSDFTGTNNSAKNDTLLLNGIHLVAAGLGTFNITGNIFRNFDNQATGKAGAYGMLVKSDGVFNIKNNTIENVTNHSLNPSFSAAGIYCELENTPYPNVSAVANVEHNKISNITGKNNPAGIYVTSSTYSRTYGKVSGNEISGITAVDKPDNNATGILMYALGFVSANKVSDVSAGGLGTGIKSDLSLMAGDITNDNAPLFSNNMISGIKGDAKAAGFHFYGKNTIYNLYHNSVRFDAGDAKNNETRCLIVGNSYAPTEKTTVDVQNNLFSNEKTTGNIALFEFTANSETTLGNNLYYTASGVIGKTKSGVSYTNINKWNTAANDASVRLVQPVVFVSATDLHLGGASASDPVLHTPLLTDVPQDYDNIARSTCRNAAGACNYKEVQEVVFITNSLIIKECNTKILIEAKGGVAPFKYNLDGGAYSPAFQPDSVNSSGTWALHIDLAADALTAGDHTINFMDAGTCRFASTFASFTTTLYPAPVIQADNACVGNNVVFTSGQDYATYLWEFSPEAGASMKGDGKSYMETFSWTSAGDKTVTLTTTDANGCEKAATKTIRISMPSETGPLYRIPNLQ